MLSVPSSDSMALWLVAATAAIAQLGERQTEDLKVPGSIPGLGIYADAYTFLCCKSVWDEDLGKIFCMLTS